MMRGVRKAGSVLLLLALLFDQGAKSFAQSANLDRKFTDTPSTVIGMTSPRERAVLAAVLPGRIAHLPAVEGEFVQKGDIVVALDAEIQVRKVEMARATAQSTMEVDLARQRYGRAKLDVDRLTNLQGDDSASSKELRDATIMAEIERISFEAARFDQEQAGRLLELEEATLAEYRLRAPFSGYVVEHLKREGETVDALVGIVSLAQLDPLQVVLDCPLALAREVHTGDRWMVRPAESIWSPRVGVVTLVNRVGNGASQTFKVKLSVENADGDWIAGMKVRVDFADGSLPPRGPESQPRITSPREEPVPSASKVSYEERP